MNNNINTNNTNSLIYYCRVNNEIKIRRLIACRVNINQEDNYGNTPLIAAYSNERVRLIIIKYLIENGANITKKKKINLEIRLSIKLVYTVMMM